MGIAGAPPIRATLPKAEHDADEWQAAMQALLHDGPPMFARIGIMRALNRYVERVFDRRARTSIGDKLVRDQ
jgi:hypothetical protein